MNIAEYIARTLKVYGIDTVFGYQGGNITYVVDAISREDGISYVQTYHEQGAAFAANAYAQVSENFGVAVSSSGPGAINMINGVANAYFDSIPCLFITGNVNTASMKTSDAYRQNGFQETDIVSLVRSVTKYAVTILDAQKAPQIIREAIEKMLSGRPGPVLLDIPHNIQRTQLNMSDDFVFQSATIQQTQNPSVLSAVNTFFDALMRARRPVLLVGNGCRKKETREMLRTFLERHPMPVVSSLCGKDVLDNTHHCYRGMIGGYGFQYSNRILNEADLVLVLGSRLDERQRTVAPAEFLKNAEVFHIDVDPVELGHVCTGENKIHSSVNEFLAQLLRKEGSETVDHTQWLSTTAQWAEEPIMDKEHTYGAAVHNELKRVLGSHVDNSVLCVDVGNNQMVAAQAVVLGKNSYYLNSGGLGSMGYALPAAIGAYYAAPDRRVICIAGDGGMMMNIQELQTIARDQIPIAVLVLNNHGLGMIENYQKLAFEGRLNGSRWGYSAPDFEKVAAAFDITYTRTEQLYNQKWLDGDMPVFAEMEI